MADTIKIWIDLENTPHVLFFNPIIKELTNQGYQVETTARDYAQVYALADLLNIKHHKIGRHYGKNKLLKTAGLITRAVQLYRFGCKVKPQLAISHGSRSLLLATKAMRIPSITAIDYEHTKHFPLTYPTLTIMPQVLHNSYCRHDLKNRMGYPGIKEDVYVQDYCPDNKVLKKLGIEDSHIIVTIRPPATEAHYHDPKSDELFEAVIEFICKRKDTRTIILPRTKKQDESTRITWPAYITSGRIIIPDEAVNGLDLIWFSDLVISGGGTMIREAAALNVPAYSFFQGKTGAVDNYLSETGRLILLNDTEDIATKIKLTRRSRSEVPENNGRAAIESILKAIDDMLKH